MIRRKRRAKKTAVDLTVWARGEKIESCVHFGDCLDVSWDRFGFSICPINPPSRIDPVPIDIYRFDPRRAFAGENPLQLDSPAAKAGLVGGSRPTSLTGLQAGGDLVVAIDGNPVKVYDDLIGYLVDNKSPGDKVTLTVVIQRQIPVWLGERCLPDLVLTDLSVTKGDHVLVTITNGALFTPMHGFRGKLTDEQILDVLSYIRSVVPFDAVS